MVQMNTWVKTPYGARFLQLETAIVSKFLSSCVGYHMLLLGEPCFQSSLIHQGIQHPVVVHPFSENEHHYSYLRCRQDKLAVQSDAVDYLYLAHCLESANNSHEILREAYRVLVPEGYVIITGFNPWSLMGICRPLFKWFKKMPAWRKFYSLSKIKDWLSLLDFEVIETKTYLFHPPINAKRVLRITHWFERFCGMCFPFFGGSYFIVAKKRIIPLSLIKPRWHAQAVTLGEELVNPPALTDVSER